MLKNLAESAVYNYYNIQSGGTNEYDNKPLKIDFFMLTMTLILFIFLIAFLGTFLWNEYLVKYVTICNPVNSWTDILALVVLFDILFMK